MSHTDLRTQLTNQLNAQMGEHIRQQATRMLNSPDAYTRQFYQANQKDLHAMWGFQFCFAQAVELMIERTETNPRYDNCGNC